MRLIFFIVLFFLGIGAYAQPVSDQQLAVHYFQAGEFDKALLYYEKLYDKNPSEFYYTYYFKCLIQLEQYKDAEKLAKKQLKLTPQNIEYNMDLGVVYQKMGEEAKAKQVFEKSIKDLPPNQGKILQVAKKFQEIGENNYALETLLKGKKLLKDMYPFNIEIGDIYASMRKYEAAIAEYLDMLEINAAYIQTVQNALGRSISFEGKNKQNQLLKDELLRRIQKDPNNAIYPDMVIWIFMQLKDFDNALTQCIALDKRMKEEGGRVLSLANMCLSNGNYQTSKTAYDYVVSKGKTSPFYSDAKKGLLQASLKQITQSANYTDADIKNLEQNYFNTITELGESSTTMPIMKDLAFLEAYYVHNTDTAQYILEKAIKTPRISPQEQAALKLDLGDVLLMKGEIWDAALVYGQVDKDFKYDHLGEIAKFKSSKIYYYTGNFKFAKGQLDVLKGSTSKLIANDAMSLSILISDNTTVDTTTTPMKMFARADFYEVQNKDEECLAALDSIVTLYPGHSTSDEILMMRNKIAFKQRKYEESAKLLQEIIDRYSYDILADDAAFKLAELYHFYLNDLVKAQELYEKIMLEYPGSLYVVDARKRFRELRGDKIN